MLDNRLMGLSVVCIVLGVLLILYPKVFVSMSRLLDRSISVIDGLVMRYRYVVGIALAISGYALFQVALLIPR